MSRLPIALAASVALSLLPAARADDAPAPLKFAWPVPSKPTVTEKIWKHGHTATTRYSVSVEKSGDDLKVRFDDFAFTEFDGKPPDDPAVAKDVAVALPMAKLIPDLLLSADGRVKDVVGLDAMIEAEVVLLTKGADDAQQAAMRARLSTPEAKEAIRREATKNWSAWVGEWAGLVVPEGKDVETRHVVRDVDGTERDAPAVLQRTASADGPGLAQLTRAATLDGDATKPSLDVWVTAMAKKTGQTPPDGLFTGLVLTNRVMVVTDAATLRPKRAIREEACIVHRKEHEDLVAGVERHEFAFDWPAPPKPAPSDK